MHGGEIDIMIALLTIQYNDSTKNIEIRDMVFSTEWFGPYVFQKEPDSLIAGVFVHIIGAGAYYIDCVI